MKLSTIANRQAPNNVANHDQGVNITKKESGLISGLSDWEDPRPTRPT